MRQPRWARGAYALAPRFRAESTPIVTDANVECWRGTAEELLSPLHGLAFSGDQTSRQVITLTWADGQQNVLNDIRTALETLQAQDQRLGELLLLRGEGHLNDASLSWILVAKNQPLPGMTLRVQGANAALVRGAAEQAFHSMMIGYVDRMSGWRGLSWLFTVLAPILLASIAVSSTRASATVRLVVLFVAAVSGVVTFLMSAKAFHVKRGIEILSASVEGQTNRAQFWTTFVQHRLIRATGAVLGALAIGIIGNKLSELMPWP